MYKTDTQKIEEIRMQMAKELYPNAFTTVNGRTEFASDMSSIVRSIITSRTSTKDFLARATLQAVLRSEIEGPEFNCKSNCKEKENGKD